MELINSTIGIMLAERARNTPEKLALRYEGEEYTWQQLDAIAKALSVEMQEMGLKRGDCVGILGSNSAAWIFHYFALMKLGAVAVLFSTRFKETEIDKGAHLTKIKGLIYSVGYKNESYDSIMDHFHHKDVTIDAYIPMERSLEEWKVIADKGQHIQWTEAVNCNDIASILFTSGTTSNSKGVQLTHFGLLNNARSMVAGMHWTSDDMLCVVVPLFHCFGITACVLSCLCAGAAMTVMRTFRTVEVCKCVSENKCTILNGVPSMFLAMLKNKERSQYDLSSVTSGIIAGSPIFAEEYLDICSMFHDIHLQPSYGQTETSPCITISDFEDTLECKSQNAGKVIDYVEARICCLKDGRICGPGEKGEIQVKGYNVMKGYIGNQEETDKTFTDDGWLKTGDMGYMSEEGYLTVTGRCKNLIIRGGENISPVEIENCIKDAVKNCEVKVFGVPSVVLQEEIAACIEGNEDLSMKKTVLDYLEKNLSDYKIPKYLFFVGEMPRSSTGKIDEKLLKIHIMELIESNRV